ncbi:MAG: hypothetical protein WBX38_06870 [Candidatus Sulfotelmatobacter sp.]
MRIDETTDAFWVLYLVNVLQPISADELEVRTRRFMEAAKRKPIARLDLTRALADLVRAGMALKEADGCYAVTVLGLQKLSLFNLGLARDKNRMFVLKNQFRK